jgi:hypothetical protein
MRPASSNGCVQHHVDAAILRKPGLRFDLLNEANVMLVGHRRRQRSAEDAERDQPDLGQERHDFAAARQPGARRLSDGSRRNEMFTASLHLVARRRSEILCAEETIDETSAGRNFSREPYV